MTNPLLTRPLNILLVEDNEVDRRLLQSMLAEAKGGHFIKAATTLNEAFELLKNHDFDVIILDLNLGDSQGEITLEKITKEYPKVAVVINTGAYEDDMGIKTLSGGSQDFLVKGKYTAYILNKVIHFAVERKRLMLELMEANQELRDTQNQLIQAEKMRVIGGLASGVAHEVKNPLATILYGVTYLNDQLKVPDENVKYVITSIKEAAERANDIITDLLDFSSISKLKKDLYSINEVITKAVQLVEPQFKKDEIKIKTNFSSVLSPISIDGNRIEQVMINLLLNAAHSIGKKGEVVIATQLIKAKDLAGLPFGDITQYGHDQNFVIVNVDDNGKGIPADKIDKVFEPFFTTRRADGGIGLGLSVSKNIIDMHEGQIILTNLSNGGARAIVLFKA